jgi:hypothetical protein
VTGPAPARQRTAVLSAAVATGAAILAATGLHCVRMHSEHDGEQGLAPDLAVAGRRPC